MSAHDFIAVLYDKGVRLFSVTDHNCFSKIYFEEIQKELPSFKEKIICLPGAELDTYFDSSSDYIHVCVYFDLDVNLDELEKKINFLYKNTDGTRKKPQFDEIIETLFDLKTRFIIIPHGDKENRGLFDKLLKGAIKDTEKFYKYAMYKVFNAYDVKPSFYGKGDTHWAANFYSRTKSYIDKVKALSDKEIIEIEKHITEKIKGKIENLSALEEEIFDYLNTYGGYFSYFASYDWHNAEPYLPEINNFIFGNLDYPFDSLELATFDPVSRIEHSKDKTITISDSLLKEVNFSISGNQKTINFSPGLNAIVGKRGSGKSLLVSVIRNLSEKDSDIGAKKRYSSLGINDIFAVDRGDITISEGGLSSIVFLSQDDIKNIFDNPSKSEEGIRKCFKDIPIVDKTYLVTISNLLKQIKPYNKDYKTITNNIKGIKGSKSYSLIEYEWNIDDSLAFNLQSLSTQFSKIIDSLDETGLNASSLKKISAEFEIERKVVVKKINLYKEIISSLNLEINDLNKGKDINEKTIQNNKDIVNQAFRILISNLSIKANYIKLKALFDNFKFNNPQIGVSKKYKYLFVSYYKIPSDLKDQLLDSILKTINRARDFDDIYNYIDGGVALNKSVNDLSTNFDKTINGDIFEIKKSFISINNSNFDEKCLLTVDDLAKSIEDRDLIDLNSESLGVRSVAYLDMLFNLDENILVIDQPEDNIDNDYISNQLVPLIKKSKKGKQLIFVTHNPSIAVYGDAFNYIYATNDGDGNIEYKNYYIEKANDKEKLLKILEGGRPSFSNRNKKFGNVLGEEIYGIKKDWR